MHKTKVNSRAHFEYIVKNGACDVDGDFCDPGICRLYHLCSGNRWKRAAFKELQRLDKLKEIKKL